MFRAYLAAVRELPRPPRLFLIFTAVNVFSWQCIAGPALVLFARAVNMPPAWVGVLLSFLPISMLLVVFTVPLVEWLGPRKLLLWTWMARNVFSLSVFLLPWAVSRWGEAGGWHVLLFATLAFSLVRAVGVGAWYPWLHEIVPRPLLGSYFSIEAAMSQVIIIALALVMALVLGLGQELNRFFLIYAAGIGAGFWSVQLIGKIPGGAGSVTAEAGASARRPALREALADREYRRFFVLAMLGTASVMWLNAASVMYLRDMLSYSETRIMLLLAAGGIGVAATVHFWGRAADRFGSVPAMIQLLAAHALLAFCWWGLLPNSRMTGVLAVVVIVFTTIFNAAFTMVTASGMLCRVRDEGRVAYTSLWILGISTANGLPPILAGLLIDHLGMFGFRLCFLIAGCAGLAAAGFMFALPPEEGKPPLHELRYLIQPSQPLRSLARVFWITVGFGEKKGGDGEAGDGR
ncbi:MAG: MFS transporter [Proteobacteria bacterium]|nr:MFS transporter [Pseudomonadota bacterium]